MARRSPPDPHHIGQQGRRAFPMGARHLSQARRRARFPAGVCLAGAGDAGVPDGAQRGLAVQNVVGGHGQVLASLVPAVTADDVPAALAAKKVMA